MGNILNEKSFLEVLNGNQFKDSFNIQDKEALDIINKSTIKFINSTADNSMDNYNYLNNMLTSNNINIASFFKFLNSVSVTDFCESKYRDLLVEKYSELFDDINKSEMTEVEKFTYKMEVLNMIEDCRARDQEVNYKNKKLMYVSGAVAVTLATISGGIITMKYMEHREKMEKIKAVSGGVNVVFKTIGSACEAVGSFFKR